MKGGVPVSFNESRLERWSGVFFAFLSILFYFGVIPWQIRHVPGVSLSPRTFPNTITVFLFVLSVALCVSGWLKRNRTGQKIFSISCNEIKLAALTLLTVGGYTLLLYIIPYIPATFIVLAVLIRLYGQRKWWKLSLVSLILPVLIYVAFTYLLRLQLP